MDLNDSLLDLQRSRSRLVLMHAIRRKMLQEVEDFRPFPSSGFNENFNAARTRFMQRCNGMQTRPVRLSNISQMLGDRLQNLKDREQVQNKFRVVVSPSGRKQLRNDTPCSSVQPEKKTMIKPPPSSSPNRYKSVLTIQCAPKTEARSSAAEIITSTANKPESRNGVVPIPVQHISSSPMPSKGMRIHFHLPCHSSAGQSATPETNLVSPTLRATHSGSSFRSASNVNNRHKTAVNSSAGGKAMDSTKESCLTNQKGDARFPIMKHLNTSMPANQTNHKSTSLEVDSRQGSDQEIARTETEIAVTCKVCEPAVNNDPPHNKMLEKPFPNYTIEDVPSFYNDNGTTIESVVFSASEQEQELPGREKAPPGSQNRCVALDNSHSINNAEAVQSKLNFKNVQGEVQLTNMASAEIDVRTRLNDQSANRYSQLNETGLNRFIRSKSRDEDSFEDRITEFYGRGEDSQIHGETIGANSLNDSSRDLHNSAEQLLDSSSSNIEIKQNEPANGKVENHGQNIISGLYEIDSDACQVESQENEIENDSATETQTTTSSSESSPVCKPNKKDKSRKIPRFYFPGGHPKSSDEMTSTLQLINAAFQKLCKENITCQEMATIAKACGFTSYWKSALFKAACQPKSESVSKDDVIEMWKRVASTNHDNASRFVAMLAKPGRKVLDFDDLLCLLQDVVESHPGLVFLRDAPEFHTRYMNTVIARIFYAVNRSWSGYITVPELRKSNFLETLDTLEDEEDINMICDYFSYEHFYVIYCKFWELDTDHDLVIDKMDLLRHANGALSNRLIDRVLSGAVTRWDSSDHRLHKMSYVDFVWFLISEEDKKSQTSIEYWFRCMDVDGDGVISMYEMEFFYEDQMRKLEQLDIEPLPFEDCVCQMLDMVKPINRDHVTLKDLKQCKMAHVFFDTFFNVEKYLDNEQKDPFAPQKDADALLNEPSDWEKYAADEYEVLVAEEQANDHQMSLDMSYDDDIDPLLEVELKNLGLNQDRPLAEEKENNNVLETGDILEKNAEVAKGLTT
nr:uncharacterized protein LOC100176266 [Ciona intestinalis]|eukprot:XP_018668660.1 uncharacterized protein LOC100176266 [Ciona intestinalis]